MALAVKILDRRRPDYRPHVWQLYRLLTDGGHRIEAAKEVLMPKHPSESEAWYRQRLARFAYKNIVGTIVGNCAANVFQTPLQMQFPLEDGSEERQEPDQFYLDWMKDPKGDGDGTFSAYMKARLLEGMTCGEAWAYVQLPDMGMEFTSLAAQEAAGDLDVRLGCLDPETVINYGEDAKGLAWVMLRYREHAMRPLAPEPDTDVIRWVYLDRKLVRSFRITVKHGEEPAPDAIAEEEPERVHKLAKANEGDGAVPVLRIRIKPELWMLDKIASVARAETRKRNELDWYEGIACVPQLLYTGNETIVDEDAGQGGEGKNRKRGVQYAFEIGEKATLSWLEIAGTALEHLATRLDALEADIYKTVSEMSQAQGSGADASVLARSGVSKMRDAVAKVILAMAYADLVRDHAVQLLDLVSQARGDAALSWEATGCDSHDVVDLAETATWYATAQAIPTKSTTFKRELEKRYARAMLQGADTATLDTIENEINEAEYPDPDEFDLASSRLQYGTQPGSVEPIPEPAKPPAAA